MRRIVLLFVCLLSMLAVKAQSGRAEELFSKMTLEEKIAQLMIVRVNTTGTAADNLKMLNDIAQYQPGGVCFFKVPKCGPVWEAGLTNRMQALSKVPMFVSIDGEWGPAMRLDSCVAFPRQMTMGALSVENDSLIYQMGREVAAQCRAIGVNLNFAPCVDINNNARNPVINSRSFGESREKVSRKAFLYLNGMQDGGIIGCIKHFPGHGDTETDSHLGLPSIHKSRIELDELELYPYRQLINGNTDLVMVAHLNVPALDSTPNSVSSLSFPIVSELLKREYGYTGLIITDGMEMQGVRKQNRFEGDVEIRALLAGVDILLLPNTPSLAIQAIHQAVDSGIVPIELINDRCMRILKFKESKGLLDSQPVDLASVKKRMNSENAIRINNSIEQKAVTLLKNEDHFLPFNNKNNAAKTDSVVFLSIGRTEYNKEYSRIASRYNMVFMSQPKAVPAKNAELFCQKLKEALAPYRRVVVVYGGSNQMAKTQYGTDAKMLNLLNQIASKKEVVLIHTNNPYALNYFGNLSDYKALMVTYQATPNSVQSALEVCFGERRCEGTLPVSIDAYPAGAGIVDKKEPANFSLLPDSLTQALDRMLENGVRDQVYPGCAAIAVKDGKTLYHKAFGYYTYDHQNKMTTQTMFDVASITKVAATTLAVMKLYDEKKIQLTDHIGEYLPYLKGTTKAHLSLAELLTHTSGLPAFIPFYKDIQGKEAYLRSYKTPNFEIKVADDLYLRNDYPDTMRHIIAHCKLGQHQYLYSDLNFLLLKDMVEHVTGQPMDRYLAEKYYTPMGLTHTCFNPLEHGFSKEDIAPTEKDVDFRKQVVQGYVHDQTAALMNGNAGNAGLFTTAEELADIFQLLMDGGTFKGWRLLSEETVQLFTNMYPLHGCNVRGLGFHTPKAPGTSSIVPAKACKRIFGHQGFTGAVVWCDPDTKLIYVFLSNRVYPTCYPNKLSKSQIRLKTHEVLYRLP